MRHSPRPKARGFTLIEMMLTLAVFTIGLLGVVAYQIKTAQAVARSRNMSVATHLANNLIDYTRLLPSSTLKAPALSSRAISFDANGKIATSAGAGAAFFNATVEVGAPDGNTVANANVTVTWRDPGTALSRKLAFATKMSVP